MNRNVFDYCEEEQKKKRFFRNYFVLMRQSARHSGIERERENKKESGREVRNTFLRIHFLFAMSMMYKMAKELKLTRNTNGRYIQTG